MIWWVFGYITLAFAGLLLIAGIIIAWKMRDFDCDCEDNGWPCKAERGGRCPSHE